jgi:hypothetical protein
VLKSKANASSRTVAVTVEPGNIVPHADAEAAG